MPLVDWTLNTSGVGVDLIASPPMEGNNSVRFSALNSGSVAGMLSPSASSYAQGLEQGSLRSLMRFDSASAHSSFYRAGLIFLASAQNLPVTNGNCYYVSQNFNTLELRRCAPALLAAATTLASTTHTVSVGVQFSFYVVWIVDVAGLGGTYIEAWTGANSSFSDLTLQIQYTDVSSSKITSGNYEGIFFQGSSGSLPILASFDKTRLALRS